MEISRKMMFALPLVVLAQVGCGSSPPELPVGTGSVASLGEKSLIANPFKVPPKPSKKKSKLTTTQANQTPNRNNQVFK